MNIWVVGVGEPLPIDGDNVRLRRVGTLVEQVSNTQDCIDWFSVSFNHYEKKQRVSKSKTYKFKKNYSLHVARVSGYSKNISFQRILHHKDAARQIKVMIESCKRKPDVILVGNTPLEVAGMVTEYGKENKIPVVIDVRDLWPDVYKDSLPFPLNKLVIPYIKLSEISARKNYQKATSIIALSEQFLSSALQLADREKSINDKVIPIGYPNYEYKKDLHTFRKHWSEYGLDEKDFIIAFTGNFGRQFEFEKIIQVSKILKSKKDIKFVLCGSGENFEKIKQQVTDNVILPGWIEKEAINSLLSFSSIGIAPYINSINYRSNTPNKFGEYLSASLPILVSVQGEMAELLRENKCGFQYSTCDDLKKYILNYYNDLSALNKSKYNARKLYESKFNGDVITQKLISHLRSMATFK